jgi:hypothetical protein
VLLQPLDNGSRNSPWGGLPMDVIYIEYYVITAVLVFLIIPFAYFFYGAYDPDKKYVLVSFTSTVESNNSTTKTLASFVQILFFCDNCSHLP